MTQNVGVVVGVVRSLEDPLGQGRIQLDFPWLSDTQPSAWASVATPMAGKSRGQFFMPEPRDEVLVAFAHGDFAHPYIVGFLWNGVDTPPESNPQNRVILTPGGHTLRFEDTNGAKKIVLRSSAGHEIVLDDAARSITVQTAGNQSLVMNDGSQSIRLQGGGRIVTIQGGMVNIT